MGEETPGIPSNQFVHICFWVSVKALIIVSLCSVTAFPPNYCTRCSHPPAPCTHQMGTRPRRSAFLVGPAPPSHPPTDGRSPFPRCCFYYFLFACPAVFNHSAWAVCAF